MVEKTLLTSDKDRIMKKTHFAVLGFAILVLALLSFGSTEVPAENSPKYQLRWEEDFDGPQLDMTKWNKISRMFPEWRKYMTDNEQLYDLRKGRMRLYAKENKGIAPEDTARYLTGGISTQHKVTVGYGKVEVRARIHGVEGCWPAIWMKDDDVNTPSYREQAEIDIMEHYNKDDFVWCTIHNSYTLVQKKTENPPCKKKVSIRKEKYNVYTMEILPDKLVMSLNGKKQFEYPRIAKEGFCQYPFGSQCYLMLDMQVGNKWLKKIGVEDFPAYMDIDWVRVYDLEEN